MVLARAPARTTDRTIRPWYSQRLASELRWSPGEVVRRITPYTTTPTTAIAHVRPTHARWRGIVSIVGLERRPLESFAASDGVAGPVRPMPVLPSRHDARDRGVRRCVPRRARARHLHSSAPLDRLLRRRLL